MSKKTNKTTGPSRRTVLKGAAGSPAPLQALARSPVSRPFGLRKKKCCVTSAPL